ncbi:MAG: hypothetical protein NTU60_05840 [Candidatus Aminicenantes bacterium]|nr:hypothetical protein [Candidatus Aminicenantes bacterium]
MNIDEILKKIREARSPLARQLTMVGLITSVLEEQGKPAPVLIGGLALSYYSREVYFTSDIDLAYADREALDAALTGLGFVKKGRYWVQSELDIAVEAPAGSLIGEEAPVETVELEGGLRCVILGVEATMTRKSGPLLQTPVTEFLLARDKFILLGFRRRRVSFF